jgi:ABC-type uncharacterized transport system substrate-binding protein
MKFSRPFTTILLSVTALLVGTFVAQAHPHVQVSVKSVVVLDDASEITAVRHAWTFDEAFSAFSTAGLDTNKDGKLDRAELASLAQVNVESLSEYAYFTYLRKGKEASEFSAAKDYFLAHDGKALTLHFTLPVEKKKLAVKDVRFEVYDPSFFVAFEFAKDMPVTVEGGKLACTANIKQPNPGVTSRLSQMSESFFESFKPGSGTAEWAIPVRFECK